MSIFIKYFQPSWFQIKNRDKIIYIDPAYLKKYYTNYPKNMHNFKADPQEFKDKVEAKSDIKVVPLKIGGVYHLK